MGVGGGEDKFTGKIIWKKGNLFYKFTCKFCLCLKIFDFYEFDVFNKRKKYKRTFED